MDKKGKRIEVENESNLIRHFLEIVIVKLLLFINNIFFIDLSWILFCGKKIRLK